eukprot:765273-Hanusia_phi.AAC.4
MQSLGSHRRNLAKQLNRPSSPAARQLRSDRVVSRVLLYGIYNRLAQDRKNRESYDFCLLSY